MTINEAKNLFDYIVRKTNSGWTGPDAFNLIINRASKTLFTIKLGLEQQYQPGRPVPVIAFSETRRIDQSLREFIVPDYQISVSNGKANYPEDCVYPITCYYDFLIKKECNESYEKDKREVELVESSNGVYRSTSKLIKPNLKRPIAITKNTYMDVLPSSIPYIYLDYLKSPDEIKWGYTIDSNNRAVHDPSQDIQPKWSDIDMNMVVNLSLGYVGISLKDGDMMGYYEQMKLEGV